MNKQNITEYTNTRIEIREIKSCITTYMGYLLGGSGFAIFGLISLSKGGEASLNYLAYASFSMAAIISLLLIILMYKFTAHNRYGGYCKLLNHERYLPLADYHQDVDFISWELCWDRIMHSDYNEPEYLIQKLMNADIEGIDKDKLAEKLRYYTKKNPPADKEKNIKGIKNVFYFYLRGIIESKSWNFPAYIFVVCFYLCSIFLGGGVFIAAVYLVTTRVDIILVIISILFICMQLIAWYLYSGKLYTLMQGSGTIDAFCYRFIPARAEYLNSYTLTPDYKLLLELGIESDPK